MTVVPIQKEAELTAALESVISQVLPFLANSTFNGSSNGTINGEKPQAPDAYLAGHHLHKYLDNPELLRERLALSLPAQGYGMADIGPSTAKLLQHSVNTSSPKFLDKLWSSPSIPGIAADLLLSVINGNAHVFRVAPALTFIEKHVGKELASLFGLRDAFSGGLTFPGGAAANTTALLVARNNLFPETKELGIAASPKRLIVFISEAAHFSMSNAVQMLGLGTQSVRQISTLKNGEMDPEALEHALDAAVAAGETPFFICATAGTTVRGAYDPLETVGTLARRYNAWFHVDACWGGAAVFSDRLRGRLAGSEMADTISYNPHKLLGVPQICSFLLAKDLRTLWAANRLPAGYLFHRDKESQEENGVQNGAPAENGTSATNGASKKNGHSPNTNGNGTSNGTKHHDILSSVPDPNTVYDLASFTPQCGRRPDALKLYLHWRYYGTTGLASQVETAFSGARHLAHRIHENPKLSLVNNDPDVPCAQVCFYYAGSARKELSGEEGIAEQNTAFTERISAGLMRRGWMVDYAPGCARNGELGAFMRVACNRTTTGEVVEGLVGAIEGVVEEIEGDC